MNEERPVVPVVIRMPESLHTAIKETAALNDRSMAAEMRCALREHVERNAEGPRRMP